MKKSTKIAIIAGIVVVVIISVLVVVERGWGGLTGQLIWFEVDPAYCQKTPWDEWMNSHPNHTFILSEPRQPQIIKSYFQELGITIFDMKTTFLAVTVYIPCDAHYADFFLVSESDADKMTKLGYKMAKLPLPPNIRQIGY